MSQPPPQDDDLYQPPPPTRWQRWRRRIVVIAIALLVVLIAAEWLISYTIAAQLQKMVDRKLDAQLRLGSVLYIPSNVVHSGKATSDGDVVFFTVKDASHSLHGMKAA